jgi:hypothetical protein
VAEENKGNLKEEGLRLYTRFKVRYWALEIGKDKQCMDKGGEVIFRRSLKINL